MAQMRLNELDDNTSELLADAANRLGMKKHAFIYKQLDKIASREYEQQQKESSK